MIYELSKMLRLNPEHAEASMYSESAARAAMSRRGADRNGTTSRTLR